MILRTIGLFLISTLALSAQSRITFLQYNDLHAHLSPHKDMYRLGDDCSTDPNASTQIGEAGGLARLKTLVDSLRTAQTNSILMNIGDCYHGGVESAYTSGNAIVEAVNAIGFDIGVPGNWDFAYGPGVSRKRYAPNGPFPNFLNNTLPPYPIEGPDFPFLAANLSYQKLGPMDPTIDGSPVLPADTILRIGNVDVGFIGLTSDIVPMMHSQLAMGFNFLIGENNYINLLNSLSQDLRNRGAQVVVVMSELGIHKDFQLAEQINANSVNVFFSAHTHEVSQTPLQTASGALVVEAGNDTYLGKMDLDVDSTGTVSLASWELIRINHQLAEEPTVAQLVQNARAPFLIADPNLSDPMGTTDQSLHRPITDTLGYSNITISRLNALESNFNNVFTDILAQYGNSQAALSPGFRFDAVTAAPGFNYEDGAVASGEITVEDIYRFFPVFYTIATAEVEIDTINLITEKLLKNVFSTNAFEQEGGWVDGFAGLKFDINLNNANYTRISQTYDAAANPLAGTDTISITGCVRPMDAADVLCSHTGFLNRQDLINPNTNNPWTALQIFEDYLANDTIQAPNRTVFNDVSGRDNWPNYPWIQPLDANVQCSTLSISPFANEENTSTIAKVFPTLMLADNLQIERLNHEQEIIKVYIYNYLGQNVFYHELIPGAQIQSLFLGSLNNGNYILRLEQNQQSQLFKFVKQ